MNISQLLRSVLGDVQAADARTLELKVGQVVKGMVLHLLSEGEALVNVGGVHVRARLETPLSQGQVALLQVQPESAGGEIVLKPLEHSAAPVAEESIPELLKRFSLKDTGENRQALRRLHQEGVPLTKEAVDEFAQALREQPESVREDEWEQAALLALKRGLPATKESVVSLHRALFGQPADQALKRLASAVSEALEQDGQALTVQTRGLLGSVKETLARLPLFVPAGMGEADDGQAPAEAALARPTAQSGAAARAEAAVEAAAEPPRREEAAPRPLSAAQAGQAQAAEGEEALRSRRGGNPSGQATQSLEGLGSSRQQTRPARPVEPQQAAAVPADDSDKPSAQTDGGRSAAEAKRPDGATARLADSEPNWIKRLLKELGVDYERRLQQLPAADRAGPLQSEQEAQTSLKGLLLQLAQADDAPIAVRETAQQLVQQITGQQLLLTPDRTSMFAHVTLMLPLQTADGRQTAAVHIQSRKGRRGELDADNCRLLFDLDMRTLGSTLLDVQVVDKIVSLRVHNDQPFVARLLDESREEIASGLQAVGYQFLSLKCLPYPEKLSSLAGAGNEQSPQQAASGPPASPVLRGMYKEKPYKGVDIRV